MAIQNNRRAPDLGAHSDSESAVISSILLVCPFLLVTLWAVIFFINVLLCVITRHAKAGMILATIISCLEWMILLFIALKCTSEVRSAESINESSDGDQPNAVDVPSPDATPRATAPRFVFFLSFVLSTVALVLATNITPSFFLNCVAFFVTVPHHVAVFTTSRLPALHGSYPSRPDGVPFALLLVVLWACVFVLDIFGSAGYFVLQIISGVFAGAECVVVTYLAVQTIVDRMSEGQIRLA